jgi:hypothetical protein
VTDPWNVVVKGASPIVGVALTLVESGPMEVMVSAVAPAVTPLASVTLSVAE